jgi:hypothetical protein
LAVVLIPLNAQTADFSLPTVEFIEPTLEKGATSINNTTGHVDLVWSTEAPDPKITYELASAPTSEFEASVTRYQGADTRSFVSGLPGGSHFFRVRILDSETAGPWSTPLEVEVNYVERSQVKWLMALGTACLIATCLIIIGGSLRTRKESN